MLEFFRIVNKIIPGFKARAFRFIAPVWGSRVVPINKTIEAVTEIKHSADILEIAKRCEIRAVSWCYCRKTYGKENN